LEYCLCSVRSVIIGRSRTYGWKGQHDTMPLSTTFVVSVQGGLPPERLQYFFYTHALTEAKKDGVAPEDVVHAILTGEVIEEYPDRQNERIVQMSRVWAPGRGRFDRDGFRCAGHTCHGKQCAGKGMSWMGSCCPASPEPTSVPTRTPQPPTATPTTPAPTVPPTSEPVWGDFKPLDATACGELADAMAEALGVPVTTEQALIEDYTTGKAGDGCQMTATGTGVEFDHVRVPFDALTAMLQARGWEEDLQYAAGGPGGVLAGYRQDTGLCLRQVSSGPSEEGLCSGDEPFVVCWENLTPEQRAFTVTLNCVWEVSAD
jgi:hypothetical protein